MSEERKTLLAQAKKLGMEVDGRWSNETLAENVAEALETLEERENEAISKASDTWVYPLRDCFLGTVKQPAGVAFKAPQDLYSNWKKVGAARLADQDEIKAASEAE